MLGRKILQIERVDSTNNYVANLMNVGKIEHGTVILAEEQTQGKGQRGAQWLSKAGENLIFSIYLDTANLSVREQFSITQFSSLSVVNTLKKWNIDADVKWPNDIYVSGRKIAGILIENQVKGERLNGTIVGIGLNVNQTEFGELVTTSVKLEKGMFISIQEVVFSLLEELNSTWELLENGQLEQLNNRYLEKLWLLNQPALFKDSQGEFTGIITGITENGFLQVIRNGVPKTYDLKEISFVKN